jgi:hypothetical protein
MPRTTLSSIEQSYFIIVARLSEERLQRDELVFLLRHKLELLETTSRPQENRRLEILRSFLDTMIESLHEHQSSSCAELVFSVDEVGISEWEDRAWWKVIVPVSMTGQTIHQSIHCNLKHIFVISCVSAAGESLIPFMVSS